MTVTSLNGFATSSTVDVPVADDATDAGDRDAAIELPAPVPVPHTSEPADAPASKKKAPEGVGGLYLVALMSIAVSVDTSWRFFGQNLHITALWERVIMFAVVEVALIACGFGMRANVRRHGKPGAPRMLALALCGMAAYMAWQLSGIAEGIARVALGPVLGLAALHIALGIERARRTGAATPWARIGRELRERAMSWFGLANEERDAVAFRRARAERRVARLSLTTTPVLFRRARLARAVRASNVAHDPAAKQRMLADLAAVRHAHELKNLHQPSPWNTSTVTASNPTAANPGPSTHMDEPVRETRPRTRSRSENGAGVQTSKQPRRMLADYLTDARQHLADAPVPVTPAWVRQVIPTCPRTTSKTVADALNAERADSAGSAEE